MKKVKIVFLVFSGLLIGACAASKKKVKPVTAAAPEPVSVTAAPPALPGSSSVTPFLTAKPSTGINEPGSEELAAIQVKYKEVTMDKLKEGHKIYTQGACINCHNAKGIYFFKETDWKGIMDDMAEKAMLSDAQKDAVYKYVLSIKATQPK